MELLEEQPLTIQMQNYGGFEKVGSLGESLPASDQQTTTQPGDIVLYQGDQIVIFYGSNSWSYTRLGRVDDLTGWADALGTGDVTVTLFSGRITQKTPGFSKKPGAFLPCCNKKSTSNHPVVPGAFLAE